MRPKQSYGSGRDALKGLSSVPRTDESFNVLIYFT